MLLSFNSPTVILEEFLEEKIVCEGKINMVPFPSKFVTVPVALNFLSILAREG